MIGLHWLAGLGYRPVVRWGQGPQDLAGTALTYHHLFVCCSAEHQGETNVPELSLLLFIS